MNDIPGYQNLGTGSLSRSGDQVVIHAGSNMARNREIANRCEALRRSQASQMRCRSHAFQRSPRFAGWPPKRSMLAPARQCGESFGIAVCRNRNLDRRLSGENRKRRRMVLVRLGECGNDHVGIDKDKLVSHPSAFRARSVERRIGGVERNRAPTWTDQ